MSEEKNPMSKKKKWVLGLFGMTAVLVLIFYVLFWILVSQSITVHSGGDIMKAKEISKNISF
jgi:hypothetical protein